MRTRAFAVTLSTLTSLALLIPACRFDGSGPGPSDTAYTCECGCDAPGGDEMISVSASADDATERRSDGQMDVTGAELDMDGSFVAGLRFAGLGIPRGATIASAHVDFTSSDDKSDTTDVTIGAQETNFAAAFGSGDGDISARALLTDSVAWNDVPAWSTGEAGADTRTPDLTPLIQALVSRPDWSTQSALVLVFDATTGDRDAASFDDDPAAAPVLTVSYLGRVAARLPVCLPEPVLSVSREELEADCTGRVQPTFNGLAEAAGFVVDAASECSCSVVPSGASPSSGNEYFGYVREECGDECVGVPLEPDASNFDPEAFAACAAQELALCQQQGIEPCELSAGCLANVSATHADGDEPICLADAAGTGPGAMARQLFGRSSTCEVAGTTAIEIGDREPKKDPATQGLLEIFGGPCPGDVCPVGFVSELAMDPISFDVKFRRDPTFGNLTEAGASFVGAAQVGGAAADAISEGLVVGVGRGSRGSDTAAFRGTNDTPVELAVNWTTKHCRLEGDLAGGLDAEGLEGTCAGDDSIVCDSDAECNGAGPCEIPEDREMIVADVDLAGTLINQRPTARAGDAHTVECTSPDGAEITLDGSGSSDPDGDDIRLASWRAGGRLGDVVGSELVSTTMLGVGDSERYLLRVIDSFARSDEDATTVSVIDTTPPVISCNTPATIDPTDALDEDEPAVDPVMFTATAFDTCDADVVPEIVAFDCFALKRNGRRVDKKESCVVSFLGDTLAVLNSGGVGTHVEWTARASDDSGNVSEVSCAVEVVQP